MSVIEDVIKIVTDTASMYFDNTIISNIIDKGAVENYATNVDLSIENRLKQELAKVIPSAEFIGEESNHKGMIPEYAWIVDPIDGTANFVRDIKECCISVGLIQNGKPVLGVIYAPWLGELYVAADGEGATLNGKPIKVSDRSFRESIYYMSTCSYDKNSSGDMFNFVGTISPNVEDVRRFGSAALALAYIAVGRIELYYTCNIHPWDICAGLCILTEAGGSYKILRNEDKMWKSEVDLMAANSPKNLDQLFERHERYELYGQ